MSTKLTPHTLESAKDLLQCLNVQNIQLQSDKIRCSCPKGLLSNHFHSSKNLSAPACEVTINQNKVGTTYLRYYCHSCTEYGDLEILPYEMRIWVKNNPEEFCIAGVKTSISKALRYLLDYQIEGPSVVENATVSIPSKEFTPYSDVWLTSFPPALKNKDVTHYLYSRGLTDSTITALDIRACYESGYLYACFPYRNIEGVLSGMRGRCIAPDSEYTHEATATRGWKLLKHRPIKPQGYVSNEGMVWYREDALDRSKPVLIVEGQFDAAAIFPIYSNVTCLFTASASPTKLSFFNGGAGVVILLDNDKEGSPAHEKIMKHRHQMGKFYTVQKTKFLQAYYPEGYKDAGEMPIEKLDKFIQDMMISQT